MPDEDAHQHHRSKLRQMDSSRLTGMDTVEVAVEERESVGSNLDETFFSFNAPCWNPDIHPSWNFPSR